MIPRYRDSGNGLAWILAQAGIWIWTWLHLSVEWRLNEQYQYGFVVPFLALGLARFRLQSAPALLPCAEARPARGWIVAIFLAFALYLFGELLRQQDSTWRLVGFLLMSGATALTVVWLRLAGGPSLVRRLAFPLAFAWLALPWPSPLEAYLTGNLMRGVTAWTVHLLNATRVAALQHGNVIELSQGWVSVDTACSGVQSLQASLLVALFLGELHRFTPWGRITLVALGGAIACLANLGRIYTLTYLVHVHGDAALDKYHQTVGYLATAGTFLSIFVVAGWAGRTPAPASGPAPAAAPTGWWRLPGSTGWVALWGAMSLPVLAWAWFAVVPGEGLRVQSSSRWQLDPRRLAPGWQLTPDTLTHPERVLLGFSEGEAFQVRSPEGVTSHLFHFFWKPEASAPSMAFSHTPDVCLPSAGWRQSGNPIPVTVRHNGSVFDFALYRFRLGSEQQAVLYGNWFGGQPETFPGVTQSFGERRRRLAMLWTGPRRRGHEILTLFLPALESDGEQIRAFESLLAELYPAAPPR